jgi:hypothetical protein
LPLLNAGWSAALPAGRQKPAEDRFRNQPLPFRLGRANWSSCPIAAIAQTYSQQRSLLAGQMSSVFAPLVDRVPLPGPMNLFTPSDRPELSQHPLLFLLLPL